MLLKHVKVGDTVVDIAPGYSGNSLLCIGDSYCEGYSPEGNTTGWGKRLQQSLGLSDDQTHIYTIGGSGFTTGGYLQMANQAATEIDDEEKYNIKNIVVGGGWGDRNVTGPIDSQVSAVINVLRNNFPNAKLHYFFVAYADFGIYTETEPSKFVVSRKFVEDTCSRMGFHVMPGAQLCLQGNNLFSPTDGYHPNMQGQKNINAFLVSSLQGSALFPMGQQITSNIAGAPITIYQTPGLLEFTFSSGFHVPLEIESLTCNGSTRIELQTFNGAFPLATLQYLSMPATAIIRQASGSPRYSAVTGNLVCGNRKLYFEPIAINSACTNFLTLTNVDDIAFYGTVSFLMSNAY